MIFSVVAIAILVTMVLAVIRALAGPSIYDLPMRSLILSVCLLSWSFLKAGLNLTGSRPVTEVFPLVIDFLSGSLMLIGALSVLVGGIGVLRMPDVYSRIHAASLTDTMGTIALSSGLMLEAGFALATFKLFAIMVFLLFTGPTATYALANAVLESGSVPAAAKLADGDDFDGETK
jgi:multicomponent Na+:H+ antiporter subunit G